MCVEQLYLWPAVAAEIRTGPNKVLVLLHTEPRWPTVTASLPAGASHQRSKGSSGDGGAGGVGGTTRGFVKEALNTQHRTSWEGGAHAIHAINRPTGDENARHTSCQSPIRIWLVNYSHVHLHLHPADRLQLDRSVVLSRGRRVVAIAPAVSHRHATRLAGAEACWDGQAAAWCRSPGRKAATSSCGSLCRECGELCFTLCVELSCT